MSPDSNEDFEKESSASFVVKAMGLPEITHQSLFNEAVGNLVARRMGLEPPEGALILITEEFVEATRRELANDGRRISPGIGVGTKFVRGLANVVPGFAPSAEELEQMAILYAFDMLVQNPDRRLDNPNCAVLNGKLMPFDFDMCFSFLMALASGTEPWEVSKHRLAPQHLCHASLRSRSSVVSWNGVCAALSSMTDEEITALVSSVPLEWQTNSEKVKSHLISLLDNVDVVQWELQRSLS